MSEARVLPFPSRRPQSSIAEARRGRFMIVPEIEALDDELEGLPDDVVAFAFRRMVREFRVGRALDDDEAAYRLHKHRSTIARLRGRHGEFLTVMDGASGHARAKFFDRKVAKSSNFRRPKPLKNCQSAPPEVDTVEEKAQEPFSSTGRASPVAAPRAESSATPVGRTESSEKVGNFQPPASAEPEVDRPPPTPEEEADVTRCAEECRRALAAGIEALTYRPPPRRPRREPEPEVSPPTPQAAKMAVPPNPPDRQHDHLFEFVRTRFAERDAALAVAGLAGSDPDHPGDEGAQYWAGQIGRLAQLQGWQPASDEALPRQIGDLVDAVLATCAPVTEVAE